MSQPVKVLLMVGSPKGDKSASNSIVSYLLEKFSESGVKAERTYIVRDIRTDEGTDKLISLVDDSDILILVSPLYVDSIPAITIKSMEKIYGHKNDSFKKKQMMAIFNCGFPEPHHNDLAIDMCKKFASLSNMEWAGSVTIGMGASLEGQSLEKFSMAKNLRNGLDMAVDALTKGKPVPKEAEIISSKPFMPVAIAKFMMCMFGGMMWGKMMDKEAKRKMYDRPYEL